MLLHEEDACPGELTLLRGHRFHEPNDEWAGESQDDKINTSRYHLSH